MAQTTLTPLVSVDIVLLTLKESVLHVALALRENEPFANQWALPGGFIHPQEDQDDLDAAARILRTKTGLVSPYFEQLRSFAGRSRDPRGWSVSLAYYALVPEHLVSTSDKPKSVRWVPVDGLRSLPFDHLDILHCALERVRSKTLYSSLPLYLMPEKFTLTQLQQVYESVIGSKLDKRSFRRRVDELNVLDEVEGIKYSEGASRPAQVYTLKEKANLVIASSNLGIK